MKKIRLFVIEDNKLLREGISVMASADKDIQAVEATGDRIKFSDKIRKFKPNILLLDLGLANQNSIELVKSVKKKFPKLKIIVMDFLPIQSDINQFIDEGVSGFILKDDTPKDFINTIRSVVNGEKIFPPQVQASLISQIVDNAVDDLLGSKLIESIHLTDKEKKIIRFISAGLPNKEISKRLKLKAPIIKSYIDNIMEKMSLNNRVQISIYRDDGKNSVNISGNKKNKK